MHQILLQDQTLFLHWRKALWWPQESTLLVADTHFSKDSVFRQHGIPIPSGSNTKDLKSLTELVSETSAQRLIVLGDFIHGAMSINDPFFNELGRWRSRHTSLSLEVVAGNHDRHVDKQAFPDVVWHQELKLSPFLLKHEPQASADQYVLAGHLHPVVSVSDGRNDRLRLPVLWITEGYAVVPSFGSMTGGYKITPKAQDRLFAFGEGEVLPLK